MSDNTQPVVQNELFTRLTACAKTPAQWANTAGTPMLGELCWEIQEAQTANGLPYSYRLKIGDGSTAYANLPYYGDFVTLHTDNNNALSVAAWDGTNSQLNFYKVTETNGIVALEQNPYLRLKAGSKVTISTSTVGGVNVLQINHAAQEQGDVTEDTATLTDGGTFKVATQTDSYGHVTKWTTFTLPSIASAIATAIEGLDSSVSSTGNVYVLKSITETNGKLTAKTETQIVGGKNMSVVGTDDAITINHDPIDQTAPDAASGITTDNSSTVGEKNMDIVTGFKVDAQGHVIHIDKDSSMNLVAADIKAPVRMTDDSMWSFRETGGYNADGTNKSIQEDVAKIPVLKGKTLVWNQLVGASTSSVTLVSQHKYYTVVGGTKSIQTGAGSAISVTGGTDMVIDLTKMFGETVANSMTVEAFEKLFPNSYYPYCEGRMLNLGGYGVKMNQLVDTDTPSVTLESGRKYYTVISGTKAVQTGAGSAVSVTGGTDMVIDLTLMFGAGNEPSLDECNAIFTEDYYEYNTGYDCNILDVANKKLELLSTDSTPSTGAFPDESDEYTVDMGLPSGLLWARSNIDVTQKSGFAASPYQYGCTMFSWGNVEGHNTPATGTTFDYNWEGVNSQEPWYDGQPYGNTPGSSLTADIVTHNASQDAAYRNCGAPWHMPSSTEFQELYDNCDFIDVNGNIITGTNKLTTINGTVGIYLRSKINGNRLFFACSGYGNGTSWSGRGSYGNYWSASFNSARNARFLFFYSGGVNPQDNDSRYYGFTVRPVRYKKQTLDLDWIREIEYTPDGSSTPEKLFPYGLLSAGSVHDEVTETKAIKRVGIRGYQSGDESDSTVITDGNKTHYALSTPIEIPLDEPHPMIYAVADHGTEQQLPVSAYSPLVAPFAGEFQYMSNFKDAVLDLINRVNGYHNPVRGMNDNAQDVGRLAIYDSSDTVKSSGYAPSNATIVPSDTDNALRLPTVAAIVAYVQQIANSPLDYQGAVSSYAALPTSGTKGGDLWILSADDTTAGYQAGDWFVRNKANTGWDVIQGTVSVTNSNPTIAFNGSTYTIGYVEGTALQITAPNLQMSDPIANGTANDLQVITNVSQANGQTAATKKVIPSASVSQKGVVQLERDIHYSESPDKVPSAGQTWREFSKRNVKAVPISVVPVPAVYNTDLFASYELEGSSNPEFTVNNSTFAQVYAANMGGYLFYVNNGVVYAAKMKATDWTKFDDDTAITSAIRAATETMIHVPTCNYKASGKKMKFGGLNPLYGGDYFKSPRWVGAYQMDNDGHSRPGVGSGHSKTMEEFWNLAQAIHSDFGLANYEFQNLINALYQAMFGNLNSEYVLSDGNSRSSSSWSYYRDLEHGKADSLADGAFVTGPHCVAAVDGAGVTRYVTKFCGFEDLLGKLLEFRPGIRFYMDNGVRKAVVYDGNVVSNSAQGRVLSGVLASASGQYTTEMELGEHWDMLPKTVGGSSTTCYCDGYWADTGGELLIVGSYAYDGALCGLAFAASYYGFSFSAVYVGARLAFYGEPIIVSGAEMVAMMA